MLEYDKLQHQCAKLFQQGNMCVSNNPSEALVVMVRIPDGSIRVCIDCCAINERIFRKSFPLPRIDDLIDKLREACCITQLDLRPTYNQVRITNDGPLSDSIAATTLKV